MGIRERILARADLDQLRADKDITALAAALNLDAQMELTTRFITARTIMAECVEGVAILSALKTASANPAVEWALTFLAKDSGIDIGNAITQGMLDQLAAGGVLKTVQADALKSLALAKVTVTQEQVAIELYHPDGTEL